MLREKSSGFFSAQNDRCMIALEAFLQMFVVASAGAGFQVGVDHVDELLADGRQELLCGLVFKQSASDASDAAENHGSDEFEFAGEAFCCRAEECSGAAMRSVTDVTCDAHAVYVCGNGVEAGTVVHIVEFGVEIGVDERCGLIEDAAVAFRFADVFYRCNDVVHVAAQRGLQERALIGEVLVKRANRNSGAMGDECGGEFLFADADQNLKRGLQNGVDGGFRTRLNGRLSWLKCDGDGGWQMRTPKLKVSSSKCTCRMNSGFSGDESDECRDVCVGGCSSKSDGIWGDAACGAGCVGAAEGSCCG